MGTTPEATQRPPVNRVVWALNEDGPAQLRVRIGANFENGLEQPRAGAGGDQQQQGGQQDDEPLPDDPAAVADRTLRVTNASIGRFIGGALLLPAISNLMGSLLFRLSKHSVLLRQFLAVRPSLNEQIRMGLRSSQLGGHTETGWLKQLGMATRVALNLICGGSSVWVESDPVW